jgi:hypothetical protein
MYIAKSFKLLSTKKMLHSQKIYSSSGKVSPPPGFKPPIPKPLSVADGNYAGALTGLLSIAYRLGTGVFVVGWKPSSKNDGKWPGTLGIIKDGSSVISNCKRPVKPIIIYEYEASPYCRKVREACSMLGELFFLNRKMSNNNYL